MQSHDYGEQLDTHILAWQWHMYQQRRIEFVEKIRPVIPEAEAATQQMLELLRAGEIAPAEGSSAEAEGDLERLLELLDEVRRQFLEGPSQ